MLCLVDWCGIVCLIVCCIGDIMISIIFGVIVFVFLVFIMFMFFIVCCVIKGFLFEGKFIDVGVDCVYYIDCG